jgi:hypothetical protein
MEVNEYCSNVAIELNGWKAKLYDVARKFDRLPTGQKEKFTPQINELHMIIEDITGRVEKLEKECPTQWKPDEEEIRKNISHMKSIMGDVWDPLHIGK